MKLRLLDILCGVILAAVVLFVGWGVSNCERVDGEIIPACIVKGE